MLSSHYKFIALVVVHAQEDSSFVVYMDFQPLHYFLVMSFLNLVLSCSYVCSPLGTCCTYSHV